VAVRRAVLAFDVAGAIPAGATVVEASLRLTIDKVPLIPAPGVFSLHRATADWNEGPTNPSSPEGGGGVSQPGDTTWLHTNFSEAFWSAPGGDFDVVPSVTLTASALGPHVFASAAMAAE